MTPQPNKECKCLKCKCLKCLEKPQFGLPQHYPDCPLATPPVVPYNQLDHQHCYESVLPPCGQKVEHLTCCLCEMLNPKAKINSSPIPSMRLNPPAVEGWLDQLTALQVRAKQNRDSGYCGGCAFYEVKLKDFIRTLRQQAYTKGRGDEAIDHSKHDIKAYEAAKKEWYEQGLKDGKDGMDDVNEEAYEAGRREEREKYSEIFSWLLGESDFREHWWRKELRERLSQQKKDE